MSTVIGLDLSLTSTGIAQWSDRKLHIGNVKTKGKKDDTWGQRRNRLYGIFNEICDWVDLDGVADPDLVVVEGPSYGSQFGSPHDRSGLWWMVVDMLMGVDIPVAVVQPKTRAKYGSGKGGSQKDVVFAHAIERYTDILGERIPNDDVADAIILCAMGARQLGVPFDNPLPEENLEAMDGVVWPDARSASRLL